MNAKLAKPLTLLFFSLFILPCSVCSQELKTGLMPGKICITDPPVSFMDGVWYMRVLNNTNRLVMYEERYFTITMDAVKKAFTEEGINFEALEMNALSEEERDLDKTFYRQVLSHFSYWQVKNSKALFKQKFDENLSDRVAPNANVFADKLDRDYLLYVTLEGIHNGPVKNGKYPAEANGSFSLHGLVIDGNSGEIAAYAETALSKNGTVITEKKLVGLAGKFASEVRKELSRLQKKSK